MDMDCGEHHEPSNGSANMKRMYEENSDDDCFLTKRARVEDLRERIPTSIVVFPRIDETVVSYPFFQYKDYSTHPDPDPLTPLTLPGRVPNFPAKMHAILSRPELADIVCWMGHGRSWKVLKPREFEVRVIPTYFEHAKFSSFIRQANGWGFRRITSGADRNSYYHPQFLRGLPHLCKEMKRLTVSQKLPVEAEHEPDLGKISEIHPVPAAARHDDATMLHSMLMNGPRLLAESILPLSSASLGNADSSRAFTPHDQEAITAFQHALVGAYSVPPVMPNSTEWQMTPASTLSMKTGGPIDIPKAQHLPASMNPYRMNQLLPNSVALTAANSLAFMSHYTPDLTHFASSAMAMHNASNQQQPQQPYNLMAAHPSPYDGDSGRM